MTVCRAVGPMIGACISYDSLRPLRMLTCRLATNGELPTAPSDLLHGTIARGHVVCTGKVIATSSDGCSVRLAMVVRRYDGRPIVHKGAIVVDCALVQTAIGPYLVGMVGREA
jgi:riboflavin synthase alpha subunit